MPEGYLLVCFTDVETAIKWKKKINREEPKAMWLEAGSGPNFLFEELNNRQLDKAIEILKALPKEEE